MEREWDINLDGDLMPLDTVPLGPWSGLDKLHRDFHPAFQPGEQPAALVAAGNVYFDDAGIPTVRAGLTRKTTFVEGKALTVAFGMLLAQDEGKILKIDPNANTELVTGLSGTVSFCEHGDQIFYTDGSSFGRITSAGAVHNHGAKVCSISSVVEVGGNLPAGDYFVAAEFIDAAGIVHAADEMVPITVSASRGIRVSVDVVDSAAEFVRFYLAGPNDPLLLYVGDVAVGSLPARITDLSTEDTRCWTIGLFPPPSYDFAFSYQDWLMLVDDNAIYPSVGAAAHLFDWRSVVMRPTKILAGEGLPSGFWTVTEGAAFWVSGTSPTAWRQTKNTHHCQFCAGSFAANSSLLPGLGLTISTPVALFWSSWGLAVGLPDGQMLFPMKEKYFEDVQGRSVTFGHQEADGATNLVAAVV